MITIKWTLIKTPINKRKKQITELIEMQTFFTNLRKVLKRIKTDRAKIAHIVFPNLKKTVMLSSSTTAKNDLSKNLNMYRTLIGRSFLTVIPIKKPIFTTITKISLAVMIIQKEIALKILNFVIWIAIVIFDFRSNKNDIWLGRFFV